MALPRSFLLVRTYMRVWYGRRVAASTSVAAVEPRKPFCEGSVSGCDLPQQSADDEPVERQDDREIDCVAELRASAQFTGVNARSDCVNFIIVSSQIVMAGLVPAIHVFLATMLLRRGCPAQGRA
jgi:hypothetical protein